MVLKLYGSPLSTCTRRVALVCKEKNIPYELVVVDLSKGEHKASAFVANQPFGQVPYIVEDDGFTLFESRAIARYLALKYAAQGVPILPAVSDFKAHALFEQAASIELTNFDPFASGIAAEKVFKPLRGIDGNAALAASLQTQLAAKLDAYDKIFARQKYLAGDNVTLADLFHLPYGAMLSTMGINLLEDPSRPNLVRWWKDITARPSWQAVKDGA
ncbi:glutathione transferase [Amylocystis lapponica]|nr:glutathione transferase [Amylocystis lapponica]